MFHTNSEMILKTILEEPDNREAKRAYADALIEEGQEARGNFIMNQLGKVTAVRLFSNGVSYLEAETALAGIPFYALKRTIITFVDGFVSRVYMKHDDFMCYAKNLFSKHPILTVHLSDRSPRKHSRSEYKAQWIIEQKSERLDQYHMLSRKLLANFDSGIVKDGTYYYFPDEDTAYREASKGCVRYGRKKARLGAVDVVSLLKKEYELCSKEIVK